MTFTTVGQKQRIKDARKWREALRKTVLKHQGTTCARFIDAVMLEIDRLDNIVGDNQ